MSAARRIVVAGGGVTGLATARALQQHSLGAMVLERNPDRNVPDHGWLFLWPNAMRALARLGLDPLQWGGHHLTHLEYRSASGQSLWRLPFSAFESHFGFTVCLIRRPRLVAALESLLEPGTIRFDAPCSGFAETADGVRTFLADSSLGQSLGTFDGVVGCEGIRSPIRSQLHGQLGIPRTGFLVSGIADVPMQDSRDKGSLIVDLESGLAIVKVLLDVSEGRGRLLWAAQSSTSRAEGSADKAQVMEGLRKIRQIDELMDQSRLVGCVSVRDLEFEEGWQWGRGRATLAGDAAHAVAPEIGQGAALGLEDARCLAASVAAHQDTRRAFRHYEWERRERTCRVVQFGRLTHEVRTLNVPGLGVARALLFPSAWPTVAWNEYRYLFGNEQTGEVPCTRELTALTRRINGLPRPALGRASLEPLQRAASPFLRSLSRGWTTTR